MSSELTIDSAYQRLLGRISERCDAVAPIAGGRGHRLQRQRRYVPQPRVGTKCLPWGAWEPCVLPTNRQAVVSIERRCGPGDATPLGNAVKDFSSVKIGNPGDFEGKRSEGGRASQVCWGKKPRKIGGLHTSRNPSRRCPLGLKRSWACVPRVGRRPSGQPWAWGKFPVGEEEGNATPGGGHA